MSYLYIEAILVFIIDQSAHVYLLSYISKNLYLSFIQEVKLISHVALAIKYIVLKEQMLNHFRQEIHNECSFFALKDFECIDYCLMGFSCYIVLQRKRHLFKQLFPFVIPYHVKLFEQKIIFHFCCCLKREFKFLTHKTYCQDSV